MTTTRTIGVILSGVTGRMGANQHLARSIVAIMRQGGIRVSDDLTIMPDPILVGRNEQKLAALAREHGLEQFTTDLDAALGDPHYEVFFDASSTQLRKPFVERAAAAGKAIYCEKPTADNLADALQIVASASGSG